MSRLLAEPAPLDVAAPGGVPRLVRMGRREHAVRRIFARWRVDADWWRTRVDREYWKVDLGEASVCEIYQDRLGQGWWLSRVYD